MVAIRLLVAAATLIASPALAGKNDPTWNPPARYDHPYKGRLEVHYLPQPEVFKKCRDLHRMAGTRDPSMNVKGCAKPNGDHCIIYIVNKKFGLTTPKAILRHELGHCNGWHPSHPE